MPSVPEPKGPTAAQLAARAAHGAALALGVATMSHAWADATTKARQLVFSAFCTYVTQLGFTLTDMGPGDIIAWLEGTYIPAHQGSRLPDGTACTSVSGVFSALAHLSTAYTMTGRDEVYTSTNPHGNPCKHSMITIWRRAYRIKMFVLGLKVGSAVPLSQAKVMALLAYVDQRASKAPTALACICYLQDYLCFLFCWLSCMRGKDSGKLELGDLFLGPDGTAQLAYPLPPIIPAGTVVVVKPNGDKTHRSCRGDPIPVTAGLFGWDDYPNRLSHSLPSPVRQQRPCSVETHVPAPEPFPHRLQGGSLCPRVVVDQALQVPQCHGPVLRRGNAFLPARQDSGSRRSRRR